MTAGSPSAPVAGGEPDMRLDGISKRFGGLTAVDGVTIELPPGGRLAVIGPNGAGKSTLFRLIAGEYRPTAGRVHLLGEDVTRLGERARARRGIARTFQVSNLFEQLSVFENVCIAAQVGTWRARSVWGRPRPESAADADSVAVLDRVGLGARLNHPVHELSHGEQRQLEIAVAMVRMPRLLLLDEPAAGLSASERGMLRGLLETIPRETSVVLIEHDMSLALELSDMVLCLDNGVPLAYGTPEEIRANPAVQAVYLGRRD
ncbi:ABC transporter ATP-binding protein [Microbacterium sp. ARD32]|uniref:ABC transporter ATP-binding protein n=1 Tax=Microbacterium sp. ARD32 TaxID=2962577 RepID=UPI00288272C4|nr:ABC transporter ATP-binding protein [Microbacterium sp. ARD32]MDT0156443.1 ABC transporter ATP-binding protein [Microbacterium sp. ARD32]